MEIVFVYGTLKKGYCNHHLLERCDGFTAFAPGIDLHNGHYYPYAKFGTGTAKGEAYYVDDDVMVNLDRLEGVPFHYQKAQIEIIDELGMKDTAWIYVSPHYAVRFPLIESGEWVPKH